MRALADCQGSAGPFVRSLACAALALLLAACGSVASSTPSGAGGSSGGVGAGGSGPDAATGSGGVGAGSGGAAGSGPDAATGSGGQGGVAGTGGSGQDGGPADGAGTDAGDASTAPWTPSQLPGLALWLMGDTGVSTVSSKVTTWADQSGHNNTATQSVAANQPTLVTGAVNGHAVLAFGLSGASTFLQIPDAATLSWGTGDFAVEIVASSTQPASGYAMMYGKQKDNLAPYPGISLWMNYPLPTASTTFGVQLEAQTGFDVASATSSLNDGTTRLYGGRRTGMILEARVNGALSTMTVLPTPAIDVSAAGFLAYIGGHPMSGTVIQALQGNIAEVVAVGGSITPADLTKLESYLKGRYGL